MPLGVGGDGLRDALVRGAESGTTEAEGAAAPPDGLPKMKDFPVKCGGSGGQVPE